MKQFLSGNTQDQMNAFDGKKIDFFAKISPTKNKGLFNQPNLPIQKKEKLWEEKYVKRHHKQNNLHYSLNF